MILYCASNSSTQDCDSTRPESESSSHKRSSRRRYSKRPRRSRSTTVPGVHNFRYGEDSCQNLIDCVEAGIPVEIVPVTLMGLIAPVTLVGATVFHTADVLGGITIAQLIRPGAPVLFGGAPATFHMRAASSPMAAIEALHLGVASTSCARSSRSTTSP